MIIYTPGREVDGEAFQVPLSSAVLVFLEQYCLTHSNSLILVDDDSCHSNQCVTLDKSALDNVPHYLLSKDDIPPTVQNCTLPVACTPGDNMVRSGLCGVARHIIKMAHVEKPGEAYQDLLGFRCGSLKACAEVSGWTKLCEVEVPGSISGLMSQLSSAGDDVTHVEIPLPLLKLEWHFNKPALLHNDDKSKRSLVRQIQQETLGVHVDPKGAEELVDAFFSERETETPHGNVRYRVLRERKQKPKKFKPNKGKKNVISENTAQKRTKCSTICRSCNENLEFSTESKDLNCSCSEEQSNNCGSRLVHTNVEKQTKSETGSNVNHDTCKSEQNSANSAVSNGNRLLNENNNMICHKVDSIDELISFVNEMTLLDVEFIHLYSEGVQLTIADIFLFVYFYYFVKSLKFQSTEVFEYLPNIKKWLSHIVTLPRIQQVANICNFNTKELGKCLQRSEIKPDVTEPSIFFEVPENQQEEREEDTEISRRFQSKYRAIKPEIAGALQKIQCSTICPDIGQHPRGSSVQVNWKSIPLAANPKDELPEKRVPRKCEQLENLATAVEAIARPGDIIVDFCSGGGHLGIIIAYLLPECKVYLVENKEESLMRAKNRVERLELDNVLLYQCNMDYFCGKFDIGVCLHACGVATDMVLQQCLNHKAAFVICPCCYGGIQNTHLITYPRSQLFQGAIPYKDFLTLGHAADQTEFSMALEEQGKYCMNLVDTDRATLAKEQGYTVTLCSLQPPTCTPKNNLLIGTPPAYLE